MENTTDNKQLYYFLSVYALIYMLTAIYGIFTPVYLNNIGFNSTYIGILLSIGPFVSIFAQPIWGSAGDRAGSKNNILILMIFFSGVSFLLYKASSNFYYLFLIISIYTFFQTSINPLTDAITLEFLDTTNLKFGTIRLAGTIGYAFMAIIAGYFSNKNINFIFPLYFLISIGAIIYIRKLPKIVGHQTKENKVSMTQILKYKDIMIFMLFNMMAQISLGFYNSFFPIYYKNLGAGNSLLGWAMLIAALSEVPFLLFAHKIVDKLDIKTTLLISSFIMSLRWLITYSVENIYLMLLVNLLHGTSFIVFSYCTVTYINKNIPKELKASGQTMNGLIGMGFGRIIGSMAGGFLSDIFGIRKVFLFNSVFAFTIFIVFYFIFKFLKFEEKKLYKN